MDTKVLTRILESLACTIKHLVSPASCLTLEVQQVRRDTVILSAHKSLFEIAKLKLTSTLSNAETLKNDLISKTVTSSHSKAQAPTSKSVKPKFKKPTLRP